jgi:hypothetical protein
MEKKQKGKDERPIVGIRVWPDIKKVFDELTRLNEGKWQQSRFCLDAIIEKLERDYPIEFLRKLGYVKPEY